MRYLVVWSNGSEFIYKNELQARKSMLNGDKIYQINIFMGTIKELN